MSLQQVRGVSKARHGGSRTVAPTDLVVSHRKPVPLVTRLRAMHKQAKVEMAGFEASGNAFMASRRKADVAKLAQQIKIAQGKALPEPPQAREVAVVAVSGGRFSYKRNKETGEMEAHYKPATATAHPSAVDACASGGKKLPQAGTAYAI